MSAPSEEPINRHDAAHVDGIIENISTIINDAQQQQPNNDNLLQPIEAGEEEENLSLSTATSATSIASALSDGEHRPRSTPRPRSASFNVFGNNNNAATAGGESGGMASRAGSTPRQRSTPRSRPRSNPRTRTPMRNPSPLLVMTGGRSAEATATAVVANAGVDVNEVPVIVEDDGDDDANSSTGGNNDNDESMVRNIFNARRHRSRAGSIPEEAEVVAVESITESTTQNALQGDTTTTTTDERTARNRNAPSAPPRAAGNWLARAAAATAARARRRSANPSRSRNPPVVGPSAKQRPSHRKLRRWNNDRFVGTSSEATHIMLESRGGVGGGDDLNWKEHFMPNYPCEYRSEFAKLSTDEGKRGVKERFLKGEVANGKDRRKKEYRGEEEDELERRMVEKLKRLGISLPKSSKEAGVANYMNVQDAAFNRELKEEMGKRLFQSLGDRIRSVLSRSCSALGDDDDVTDNAPSFAARVAASFEAYLVSLALAGSKKDVVIDSSTIGYPPLHSDDMYQLFDTVLASPPKVVIRKTTHYRKSSSVHEKCEHAVLVPTVHFYFPENIVIENGNNESGNEEPQQSKSTAFYRILLYAVCQFHGLESSSSIMNNSNGAGGGGGKRRSGQRRGMKKKEGVFKVVTVHGGVLLAPGMKLLDFVE